MDKLEGIRQYITTMDTLETSIPNKAVVAPGHYDEERSETRYVLRIAELSESSKLRTHTAL